MPIDRFNKVLFIHIPKNAGKSITTTMSLKPAEGRRSFFNSVSKFSLSLTKSKSAIKNFIGISDHSFVLQHLTLKELEILSYIDKNDLKNLTIFTVVRNPFARIKSSIRHFDNHIFQRLEKDTIDNQDDLLEALKIWFELNLPNHNFKAHRRKQVEYLYDLDGKLSIKHRLSFENLEEDWKIFCRTKKLNYSEKIIRIQEKNKSYEFPKFNKKAIEMIIDEFNDDFEFLGYSKEYNQ